LKKTSSVALLERRVAGDAVGAQIELIHPAARLARKPFEDGGIGDGNEPLQARAAVQDRGAG
jgi:hypothetical protein